MLGWLAGQARDDDDQPGLTMRTNRVRSRSDPDNPTIQTANESFNARALKQQKGEGTRVIVRRVGEQTGGMVRLPIAPTPEARLEKLKVAARKRLASPNALH